MDNKRTFTQRFQVAGEDLKQTVTNLINDVNAKEIVVRNAQNREVFKLPLSAGLLGGGVGLLFAPVLTVLASIAVVGSTWTVEVTRVGQHPQDSHRADHDQSDRDQPDNDQSGYGQDHGSYDNPR